MSTRFPVLVARRRPAFALLRFLGMAIAGSLLLAVSAHVKVPFWPVPMTLQTLAVLLIGVQAGPAVGAAAVVLTIGEGLLGLPVFTTGGAGALFGPTGGFIAGFLPAVLLAGIAGRARSGLNGVAMSIATLVAADAVVLLLGWAWLATTIGGAKAFAVGIAPFLLGEAVKVALAAATVPLRRLPRD